jgi:AraC family ethanolamine operon transcriptional activator
MNDNFIMRTHFSSTDYDELATMFTVAHIEEKILEPGHFNGEVSILQSPNVIINNFKINKKVLQVGTGVSGFITFTIWDPSTVFTWKKHEMKKGMIGVIWKNEHQSVTGSEFTGIPVSVEENFFINLCRNKGYPELVDKLQKNELIHVSESDLIEIRQIAHFAVHNVNYCNRSILELVESKLVDLLINCFANALPSKSEEDWTHQKFVKVIDYIHENLGDLTSINQVCEHTNVPERTVRRLVQKRYNLSPKNYLNKLRLNEVRKGLKKNHEYSSVLQVASEYNYWHMGQFTRDYKVLFGELPSETHRRQRVAV